MLQGSFPEINSEVFPPARVTVQGMLARGIVADEVKCAEYNKCATETYFPIASRGLLYIAFFYGDDFMTTGAGGFAVIKNKALAVLKKQLSINPRCIENHEFQALVAIAAPKEFVFECIETYCTRMHAENQQQDNRNVITTKFAHVLGMFSLSLFWMKYFRDEMLMTYLSGIIMADNLTTFQGYYQSRSTTPVIDTELHSMFREALHYNAVMISSYIARNHFRDPLMLAEVEICTGHTYPSSTVTTIVSINSPPAPVSNMPVSNPTTKTNAVPSSTNKKANRSKKGKK